MPGLATIDRRVEVIAGSDDQRASIRRVSDLRPLPFVVLLGEPGIGKSTVLDAEAAREGAPVLKVRKLMTGAHPESDVALFLDALDEYRTDGQPSDKVYGLADAIAAAKVPRWRLSCRSEDWRKGADIAPLQDTTAGAPIVAAQLLPLDHFEAMAVLVALGEDAPDEFLAKAAALGANGFIENPLSLKLLHKAVAGGGDWPTTRYELFKTAIRRLVHEFNDVHKSSDRSAPDDIIAAAAKACLVLLASGSRAFWRSNAEPPVQGDDQRAYVTGHDLLFDRKLLGDMFDTALFRGEGEAFEPMHRTVAEFLAGQALACAVIGDGDRTALPLSRALVMITGEDRRPPTELRGLYAWLAAHLAELGDEAGAMRLIEADAATVLAYGDAAIYATPARRTILANLDRNEPYFRASAVGVTAVGGLAGEDLASDFAAVLTRPGDGTHRLSTVLDALTSGRPVASIRPLLRTVALDPARPDWQRRGAADAWLNGADDPTGAQRALFYDLADEPVSAGREALRAHLAAALPSSALSIADIESLIADFRRIPDDHTVGRLWRLRQRLETEPRPELFDHPSNTLLPRETSGSFEGDDLLDHALAAAIRKTADLTAARLWRWTVNVRDYATSNLSTETAKAVSAWIDERQGRDVELFDAILAEDRQASGPWLVSNIYAITFGRRPSTAIIRHVLAKAAAAPTKAAAKRLLEIAVAIAHQPDADAEAYWETHDRVAGQPGCKRLLKQLTTTMIESWRREQYKRLAKRRRENAKRKAANIRLLRPILGDIPFGLRPGPLGWAAQLYFSPPDPYGERPAGFQRVIYCTDQRTADAILAGWDYLVGVDLVGVTAAALGTAEATGRILEIEWAAIAGVDRLFEEERLPDPATMPITLAIVVIKANFIAQDQERRTQLQQWAIQRLNLNPTLGAAQLADYFGAILDAGATQLNAITWLSENATREGAVTQAIDEMLATRPAMPAKALHSVLWAAAKHLDAAHLRALAQAALADPAVVDRQRTLWTFVEFLLDPTGPDESLVAENSGSDIAELFDEPLMDGFLEAFHAFDSSIRVHRETMVVRLLGRISSPADELVSGLVTGVARLSETVRRAIWSLASYPHPDACAGLAGLIEDGGLVAWHPSLRHAQAEQARLQRDRNFTHPIPPVVWAAVEGGPPVNAADLRAVVLEELERLRAELRSNNTIPWKRYWNLDSRGKPTEPRIENECRDHLLERLQDRLKVYRIAAAIPEARRGEDTRADMLMLTGAGRNLPVEAKRHYHPDIWTAASTQLQGYAAAEGAGGHGIYLVFWFGNEASPTPARPDGSDGPRSARELENMLVGDLAPDLRARTDVIAFDVSDPEAPGTAAPRKKRSLKKATGAAGK
jgi:hypothetical protein